MSERSFAVKLALRLADQSFMEHPQEEEIFPECKILDRLRYPDWKCRERFLDAVGSMKGVGTSKADGVDRSRKKFWTIRVML